MQGIDIKVKNSFTENISQDRESPCAHKRPVFSLRAVFFAKPPSLAVYPAEPSAPPGRKKVSIPDCLIVALIAVKNFFTENISQDGESPCAHKRPVFSLRAVFFAKPPSLAVYPAEPSAPPGRKKVSIPDCLIVALIAVNNFFTKYQPRPGIEPGTCALRVRRSAI